METVMTEEQMRNTQKKVGEWCKGWDLNPRTTKDKALNLASLAMLDYPCTG